MPKKLTKKEKATKVKSGKSHTSGKSQVTTTKGNKGNLNVNNINIKVGSGKSRGSKKPSGPSKAIQQQPSSGGSSVNVSMQQPSQMPYNPYPAPVSVPAWHMAPPASTWNPSMTAPVQALRSPQASVQTSVPSTVNEQHDPNASQSWFESPIYADNPFQTTNQSTELSLPVGFETSNRERSVAFDTGTNDLLAEIDDILSGTKKVRFIPRGFDTPSQSTEMSLTGLGEQSTENVSGDKATEGEAPSLTALEVTSENPALVGLKPIEELMADLYKSGKGNKPVAQKDLKKMGLGMEELKKYWLVYVNMGEVPMRTIKSSSKKNPHNTQVQDFPSYGKMLSALRTRFSTGTSTVQAEPVVQENIDFSPFMESGQQTGELISTGKGLPPGYAFEGDEANISPTPDTGEEARRKKVSEHLQQQRYELAKNEWVRIIKSGTEPFHLPSLQVMEDDLKQAKKQAKSKVIFM